VLGHWAIYPQALRALFTRAFTEGLYDPAHGRVQETEWRRAMQQLHDAVQTCPHCGAQNFYDPQRLVERRATHPCWGCGAALASAPPRIGLRRAQARPGDAPGSVVVLEPGARLAGGHLGETDADAAEVFAEVAGTPPSLCNVGPRPRPWSARLANGAAKAVAPGERIAIEAGLRIDFGRMLGEVKA
jgi:hypothetical protein